MFPVPAGINANGVGGHGGINVFPVPAGINRSMITKDLVNISVPRTCGDKPHTLSKKVGLI